MASSTIFDISNQALKLDTAADMDRHIGPLATSTNFTEVRFNGNTIGVGAAERLAAVLATQRRLERAQFADVFTGRLLSEIPAALDALLGALLGLPRLRSVDLSDNAFGLNLVAPLVRFLRAHTPLQHLVLNNNGMGPIAGAQIADALAELATAKKKEREKEKEKKEGGGSVDAADAVPDLESIVCGRNRLESGSMEAWARAYSALGTVRSIRMTQNGIRPEGIVTLLRDGLAKCRGLEVCDLQDNTFTAVGSRTLARVLPNWPALRELGLGDCYATARGFRKIIDVVAAGSNRKLQVMRLQYNEINVGGVVAIQAAIDKGGLPELRRVELNGNKFPEEGDIQKLHETLHARREAAGVEDEDDENWGLDELDELEEDSDEEEEEEEEESEEEQEEVEAKKDTEVKAEKDLEEADRTENEPVAQEKDADVDALADSMAKKLNV